MKIKITLTNEEVAEVVALHIATLMELPVYAQHVKKGLYSWDGYIIELDEEAERKAAEAPVVIGIPTPDALESVAIAP